MTEAVVWREIDGALRPVKGDQVADFAPLPGSQVHFLSCPTYEVLYEGTRGPGKTFMLLMDFAQDTGKGYGAAWQGILFRRTYKELDDVIEKSQELIPMVCSGAVYNSSKSQWVWPDGEKLKFREFKHPRDYRKYHGHEYGWIAWEELTNWPNDIGYRKMMSTSRCKHPGISPRVRNTSNPAGPGHTWVKERFQLPINEGKTVGPLIDDVCDDEGELEAPRRAIHGHLDENLVLLHAEPDYKQKLRTAATSPNELRAWLHGDWNIVDGGMFGDVWDPEVNVVEPFALPQNGVVDRSFDWGSSHPFSVGWWWEATGEDVLTPSGWRSTVRGDLYRIAEWYGWTGKENVGCKMLATEIAAGIVEREIKMGIHGRVQPGPCDGQIYQRSNGVCYADDMAQRVRIDGRPYPGVQWVPADKSKGSRVTGWQKVREMMKNAQGNVCERTLRTLPREKPGLFVFNTCKQFLRTVPALPRDEMNIEDVDTDTEDHIGDEARYRVLAAGTRAKQSRHRGMV